MVPHCEAPNHGVNRINLQRDFLHQVLHHSDRSICNLVQSQKMIELRFKTILPPASGDALGK